MINETLLLWSLIYYSHTLTGGGADLTGPVRVIWLFGYTTLLLGRCKKQKHYTDYGGKTWVAGKAESIIP